MGEHKVCFRLSDEEFELFTRDYKASGYLSKSQYIKSRLFSDMRIMTNKERIGQAYLVGRLNETMDEIWKISACIRSEGIDDEKCKNLTCEVNKLSTEVQKFNGYF